ncbi:MAG: hypothetical protein K2G77_08700, partial [Muribaculaceae bacterium]|nr:hypothetical protein [Muribaculaceae bacterium]
QLKDNMEEKELNLAELLKGCEGEKFFSPCYGNVTLSEVRNDRIIVIADVNGKKHSFVPNGSHISNPVASCVMLIPNLGLYQKYPLDARAAWMEWEEARKPKRWRAKCYDRYWGLNSMGIPENMQDIHCHDGVDQLRYEFGNYFRTEEESRQAAEAVRETLEKFHENNKQR